MKEDKNIKVEDLKAPKRNRLLKIGEDKYVIYCIFPFKRPGEKIFDYYLHIAKADPEGGQISNWYKGGQIKPGTTVSQIELIAMNFVCP